MIQFVQLDPHPGVQLSGELRRPPICLAWIRTLFPIELLQHPQLGGFELASKFVFQLHLARSIRHLLDEGLQSHPVFQQSGYLVVLGLPSLTQYNLWSLLQLTVISAHVQKPGLIHSPSRRRLNHRSHRHQDLEWL